MTKKKEPAKGRAKLLREINERRPKRGEAEFLGKKSYGPFNNSDIARMAAGEENAQINLFEAGELGFSTRVLVQATMPHGPPPKDTELWTRTNGYATLTVQSGFTVDSITGEKDLIGLPYGTLPRLIMIYLCSEAMRLKSPEISLGHNLTEFMAELGLKPTGGKKGDITRLKSQAMRLVRSRIQYEYNSPQGNAGFSASIARKWMFFWDSPEQSSLFDSNITLSSDFYQEIIAHPIPMHLGAVHALKGSSFELDLYTWLTYRVATLNHPITIKWTELQKQLGAEFSSTREFGRAARKRLINVGLVWPGLDFEPVRGGFLLKPCEPSVPRIT